MVLAVDVLDEVGDARAVAVLVVVPGDQLDEVFVERDAGVRVEDAAELGGDEVGADDLVLRVADDALELVALARLLQSRGVPSHTGYSLIILLFGCEVAYTSIMFCQ